LLSVSEMPPLLSLAFKIHKLIKTNPDNKDFSDPKTFCLLPFPSLLKVPARFTTSDHDNVQYFQYMGRLKFHDLCTRIQEKHFLKTFERLCVYGTSGSGKSHILAALVCRLIREGERVVYLPDCYRLLEDPAQVIWGALLFAFHDTTDLETIDNPEDVGNLINFMSQQKYLYVIVDQYNALELKKDEELTAAKTEVRRWLDRMKRNHRYIFSASANEKSSREVHTKQNGIAVFYILGGMTEVC